MLRLTWVACLILLSGVAAAHPGASTDVAALSQKLAERPGDVDLLLQRAQAYRQLGQPERALADLEVAARRDPGRRDVLLARGLTRAALGLAALAEADLGRFLEAGEPTAEALEARGKLREAARRWAAARADYDAALKLRATPDLHLARGRVDEAAGDLDAAARDYEEGLQALHGAVTVRLALIRVETARGRHDRAIGLIDEALASSPVKADWLLRRAEVRSAAGREDAAASDRLAALQDVEARLARHPSDLARLTRARALAAMGRGGEAVRDLEAILKSSPRLGEARALLDAARKNIPAPRTPR